jgi:hypothetical protein
MLEQQEPNGAFNNLQLAPLSTSENDDGPARDSNALRAESPRSLAKCQNGVCSLDWKPSRPA